MTTEEEDFPRSGATFPSRTIIKRRRQEGEEEEKRDSLFKEVISPRVKLKKHDKNNEKTVKQHSDVPTYAGKEEGNQQTIRLLSFKKLSVGMKMLGAIKEIHDLSLVVSLPNNLIGYVSIAEISEKLSKHLETIAEIEEKHEISDEEALESKIESDFTMPDLRKMFHIGELVVCMVISLESNSYAKKIELTMKPNLLNSTLEVKDFYTNMILPAAVHSIEDHGYVMDIGIEGIRGFLHRKRDSDEMKGNLDKGILMEGQTLSCTVSNFSDGGRTITLSMDPSHMQKAMTADSQFIRLDVITPGMLVMAQVKRIMPNGLSVSFCEVFEGTIDYFHLEQHVLSIDDDLKSRYRVGQKIRARVLYIDPVQKSIGLTSKTNLVSWESFEFPTNVQFGSIDSDTEILRIDRKMGLLARLPGDTMAYATVSRLLDEDCESPERRFKVEQHYTSRIIGFDYCDGLVHISFQNSILLQPFLGYQDIQVGQIVKGQILKVDSFGMLVSLAENIRGLCPTSHLADIKLTHSKKNLKVGLIVTCRVLSVDPHHKKLLLTHKKTLVESTLPILTSYEQIKRNLIVHGYISGVKDFGCIIRFYGNVKGIIHRDALGINDQQNPREFFKVGSVVKCRVLSVNSQDERLSLSLDLTVTSRKTSKTRPSKNEPLANEIHEDQDSDVKETPMTDNNSQKEEVSSTTTRPQNHQFSFSPESLAIKRIEDLTVGKLIEGFVRNINKNGCFVSINPNFIARVKICELSDLFIREKDFTNNFPLGTQVKGRIVGVDKAQGQIEMSLKMSLVDPKNAKKPLIWNTLKEGMMVNGLVKRIQTYGLFIKLSDSNISGLCHISEIDPLLRKDLTLNYPPETEVHARVVKIDLEKKRLNLSLKPNDKDNGSEEDEGEELSGLSSANDSEALVESDYDDLFYGENDDIFEKRPPNQEYQAPQPIISVDQVFDWNDSGVTQKSSKLSSMDLSDHEHTEQNQNKTTKTKSKKSKQLEEYEEENAIAEREEDLLDRKLPQNVDDYERLVLASPNSSYLWIKYMAFQLSMMEVEKSRAVAERALKTIQFRDEQEKLNVWLALLNLENTYGTKESLTSTFERAVNHNNSKYVHMQMIKIYEKTEKFDDADKLFQVMCKKFKESSKVWTQYGLFKLRRNQIDGARKLMQRSLLSLPKRKHIKTICKFAQMEFKYAEAECGRTIFEGIMANYPKRADLWSIFLDMEIRAGDPIIVRRLFERVIYLKFSSRKMKFFFKKYLEYEKKHGTSEAIDHVKQAARDYVESLSIINK